MAATCACIYRSVTFSFPVLLTVVLLTLAGMPRPSASCNNNEEGLVYIFWEVNTEYFKIGGTTQTDSQNKHTTKFRQRDLQTGNPRQLILVSESPVDDCKNAEAKAHETAKDLRYVQNVLIEGRPTEWYKVTMDNADRFIQKNTICCSRHDYGQGSSRGSEDTDGEIILTNF